MSLSAEQKGAVVKEYQLSATSAVSCLITSRRRMMIVTRT